MTDSRTYSVLFLMKGGAPRLVLRRRVLAPEPETLDQIAARLGISKPSVAWHEKRGLVHLLAELNSGRRKR